VLKGAAVKLEDALSRLGIDHDVKEYPTAGHSFLKDAENLPRMFRTLARISGMGPHPASAEDACQRIEAFFTAYLRTP
jgi:carboxymethylenebutenolidase